MTTMDWIVCTAGWSLLVFFGFDVVAMPMLIGKKKIGSDEPYSAFDFWMRVVFFSEALLVSGRVFGWW